MKNKYFYFYRYLKPHVLLIFIIILVSIIYTFLRALSFLVIPEILLSLDPKFDASSFTNIQGNITSFDFLGMFKKWMFNYVDGQAFYDRVFTMSMIVLVLFILKNLFDYLRRIITAWFEVSVITEMREDIYKHIMNLSVKDLDKKKSGHFISILTGDISQVFISMKRVFEHLITEPLFIISVIFSIIMISWKLSILILIMIPISGIILTYIGKSLSRKSRRVLVQNDRYLAILNETINGFKTFKSFFAEKFQISRYINELLKLKKLQFLQSLLVSLNVPVAEIVGSFLVVGIILMGAQIQSEEELRAADLVTVLMSLILILEPVKTIGAVFNEFKIAMVSIDRVSDIVNTRTDDSYYGNIKLDGFNDKIDFKINSFSYNKTDNFTLNKINFSIKKGETVALVGASGGGKTTLADLLARFYKIDDGGIFIDGYNINKINSESLRSTVSIISQEAFLLNDTIGTNVWFRLDKGKDEELDRALKMAYADEFVDKYPEKHDKMIEEKGSNLSGGQKQRVSIARTILKDTPIIILDEATSALDSKSEKVVQHAIEKLMANKTVLVIAHRLSTIINADKIIVMDNGRIIEIGKHEELLEKGGTYKKLYDIQFKSTM